MAYRHFRHTWAEVDLNAISRNIKQMKDKLPENCRMIAIVKADAYGHGAVEVAETALAQGADMLAVALLEEAITLREAGIGAPILMLGDVPAWDVPFAVQYDITLTCFQAEWIREVDQLALPSPVNVHMRWDTGMGRVGLRTQAALDDVTEALRTSQSIRLTGVYTHFATADEVDLTYFDMQKRRFDALQKRFNDMWPGAVMTHIANSAAAMRFPEQMYGGVRFGISMYGLYPSDVVKDQTAITLHPAFSLHSRLIHVKPVAAGESISYGTTYTTTASEYIGTIPIGYADGWMRKLQGMDVLVNGRRMPIVGRITMDQTMIKLDQAYPVGTKVTLIGRQAGDAITAEEVAAKLDTINYEIPCMISGRVPRLYKRGES